MAMAAHQSGERAECAGKANSWVPGEAAETEKTMKARGVHFLGPLILTRHHGAPEKSESWFGAEDWLISLGRALTACSRNMAGGRDIIGSRVNLDERSYDPGSGLFD